MAEKEIDLIKLIRLQLTIFWHVTFPECFFILSVVCSRRIIAWKSVLTDTFLHFVANRNYFPFHHLMAERNRDITRKANQNFFNSMATRTKVATVASPPLVLCVVWLGICCSFQAYAFVVLQQTPTPQPPSLMQLFRHFDTFELLLQPLHALLPAMLILHTQYSVCTFVCDTPFRGKVHNTQKTNGDTSE